MENPISVGFFFHVLENPQSLEPSSIYHILDTTKTTIKPHNILSIVHSKMVVHTLA
jgi:hypothetical protein